MIESLRYIVPAEVFNEPFELRNQLIDVVERIGQYLPNEKIWEWFSSTPNETGGKIVFPYFRGDTALSYGCWANHELVARYPRGSDKFNKFYKKSSEAALKSVLWIEVGFQGINNLAQSPSSRNWVGINESGDWYRGVMKEFIQFREQHSITEDCFTEYNAESLLDQFK